MVANAAPRRHFANSSEMLGLQLEMKMSANTTATQKEG
jgi:hypothetical protein